MALPHSTWRHYKTQLEFQPRHRPQHFKSTTIIYPKKTSAVYTTELSYDCHRLSRRFLSSVELEAAGRRELPQWGVRGQVAGDTWGWLFPWPLYCSSPPARLAAIDLLCCYSFKYPSQAVDRKQFVLWCYRYQKWQDMNQVGEMSIQSVSWYVHVPANGWSRGWNRCFIKCFTLQLVGFQRHTHVWFVCIDTHGTRLGEYSFALSKVLLHRVGQVCRSIGFKCHRWGLPQFS